MAKWQGLDFGAEGLEARNPIPRKSAVYGACYKLQVVVKRPPVSIVWKHGDGDASSEVVLVSRPRFKMVRPINDSLFLEASVGWRITERVFMNSFSIGQWIDFL
ncbi:hypothetical protein AVEN_100533-1 [Araneus ventricosus]|uniref:Uncharacterized protein n=1 Tax=Araneus ventricosus TaxID=182803 RepID=A0A4Y2ITV0_ARAVE|nr:hypothetical protein AVEN_100533-1 [Araneus ventricosus]